MKSCELNYLEIGFSKISFEGKGKKHMGFENGLGRVAMQTGIVHVCPGCNWYYTVRLVIA